MTAPRVLFYVQHLLGIGHLSRATRVAQAMVERGMAVTLITGGMPVPGFPAPGIPHVELPPVAVGDAGFAGLVDATGQPADAAYMDRRRQALLTAFHDLRPDIVMIEAYPFGRRQVRHELKALIAAVEATSPRPALVTSLRDILQQRAKPERDAETVAIVLGHFDMVLVHGDPAFASLDATFPLADQIAGKVVYSGLVCPPPPPPASERFDIVVSAGGGAVGAGLVQAALQAAHLLPDIAAWCVITGPNLPLAEVDRLAALAPPSVTLARFRPDFASLLAAARLSVSQAGYNTVGDILQAGCRALLVPFSAGGETEQTDRAERLARIGRVSVLTEANLSGVQMARAITAALAATDPVAAVPIQVDGAARSAAILYDLAMRRRAGQMSIS